MSITRRTFLKQSAIAAAGVSLARTSAASGSTILTTRPAGKKILILGAGMAGLAAGYELSQMGHEVNIIDSFCR